MLFLDYKKGTDLRVFERCGGSLMHTCRTLATLGQSCANPWLPPQKKDSSSSLMSRALYARPPCSLHTCYPFALWGLDSDYTVPGPPHPCGPTPSGMGSGQSSHPSPGVVPFLPSVFRSGRRLKQGLVFDSHLIILCWSPLGRGKGLILSSTFGTRK